jgi:DNA-binding GntR family transcriptional regulator
MSETAGSRVASQRVAEVLRERILSGRLRPGTRIKQDELAEELDTSRIPVREALRILETRGLVEVRSNSGAWVGQMDLHDLTMSYQIRERIEPLLLASSMPSLSAGSIERLAELADEMESARDVEEFLRLDRDFHLGSYAGADTAVLGDLVLGLWNRTQHYRRAFTRVFRSEGDRSAHHDHHLLVAAFRRGDVEEAERVLAAHIRRTRLELARHPEIFG